MKRASPSRSRASITASVRNCAARATASCRSRSRLWNPRSSTSRSEEHTSELQSLMRISYAVFCLKKKIHTNKPHRSKHKHIKRRYHDSEEDIDTRHTT